MSSEKENAKNPVISIDYKSVSNPVLKYIQSFKSEDAYVDQNYFLKREHTERVISNAEIICKSLELDDDSVFIAKTAALLHDVGRFSQFTRYQTFNDSLSEDHAQLAVTIIEENQWLEQISSDFKSIIIKSVLYHNKLAVPKNEDKTTLLHCNILRDADKIDILDQAVKEFSNVQKRNKAFSLELEDSPIVSKEIAKSILSGKLPDRKEMKTITDFKLMQLAFVYDLNFKQSFSIINQRQYLKKIFETLPKNDQVFDIYRQVKIHVENQLI